MFAYFIFSTDDDSAKVTLDSIEGFEGRFILITNGYKSELKMETWEYVDIRDAYNAALTLGVKEDLDVVLIRSGSQISNLGELLKSPYDITMATIIDPKNTNFEYTFKTASAFPTPAFLKGNLSTGTEETFWLDGPVIYIKNRVILSTGLMDLNLTEHFSIIDYSIRARWNNFTLGLCHDCHIIYVNEKAFSCVLSSEETNIILGQHIFARKYNGEILNSLLGK